MPQTAPKNTMIAGLLCCVVLMTLGIGPAAQAQDSAELTLGQHVTTPGATVVIPLDINCNTATGCGAFAVEILFDPAIVQIERVALGTYLGDSAFEAEKSIDHESGVITLAAAALGEIEAVRTGELATIHLIALKAGISPLRFTAIEVGDLRGMPVPVMAGDGSVIVIEEGPLQATVDLPEKIHFVCHPQPSRGGEDIQFIPGGAHVTILGRSDQHIGNHVVPWVLVISFHDGKQIGPCWTTTRSLEVNIAGEQMPLRDLMSVLPVIENASAGQDKPDEGNSLAPCTVRAERRGVAVRVGPGANRAVRSALPMGQDVVVLGWFEDTIGSHWWKIQPDDFSEYEADRYWVAAADVVASGACETVVEAEASRFVYAPPAAVPTSAPTVPPVETPQGAIADQPAGAPPDSAQPEPAQPDLVCYTVSLVIRERSLPGDANLVPSPNCTGGKYLEGTIAAVHVWGYVDVGYGCGVDFSGYYEELASIQFTVTEDCTVIVGFD